MTEECSQCGDTGLKFDSLYACSFCAKGAVMQHEQYKEELNRLIKRSNSLRIKIIKYSAG